MDFLRRFFLSEMDNETPDMLENPFIGRNPDKEKIERAKEKRKEIADGLLEDIEAEFKE